MTLHGELGMMNRLHLRPLFATAVMGFQSHPPAAARRHMCLLSRVDATPRLAGVV